MERLRSRLPLFIRGIARKSLWTCLPRCPLYRLSALLYFLWCQIKQCPLFSPKTKNTSRSRFSFMFSCWCKKALSHWLQSGPYRLWSSSQLCSAVYHAAWQRWALLPVPPPVLSCCSLSFVLLDRGESFSQLPHACPALLHAAWQKWVPLPAPPPVLSCCPLSFVLLDRGESFSQLPHACPALLQAAWQ